VSTVTATWIGPYGYKLADGTVLETGVTKVELPAGEARDSDHWQIAKAAPVTSNDPKEGDA
jgi:hypothetical protein